MSKKILITGACGFFGSHLSEYLISKGYSVVAFDRYNSFNSYGWLENSKFKNEIEFILGDIRDYDSVYKAMQGVASCMHLAALIGIPYSYISPLAYIKTNIEGTYNVLEASKNLNLEQLIITSTSEIYGSSEYTPMDELHPINSQSPYAASKVSADQMAISYYKSFNQPIKIVRPFNIYGPRQSLRAVIPSIINQCTNNSGAINIGNLQAKRDFTFVKDTCESFLEIFKSKKLFGEIVNIGSGENISIADLADLIIKKIGNSNSIYVNKERLRPDKSEVTNLLAKSDKLFKETGWSPKISLSEGINATINWIKNNKNQDDNYVI